MPLSVLLQTNLQTVKEASSIIYYVIGIVGTMLTFGYFIVRLVNRKVNKEDLHKELGVIVAKMKEDLEVFKENHEKEHANITQRLEDWSKRQNEINHDLLTRIEENTQHQREINNGLIQKLDIIIPKVERIEAKMDTLLKDYDNRVKMN